MKKQNNKDKISISEITVLNIVGLIIAYIINLLAGNFGAYANMLLGIMIISLAYYEEEDAKQYSIGSIGTGLFFGGVAIFLWAMIMGTN